MDGLEFRQRGREMVDYIVDYLVKSATASQPPESCMHILPQDRIDTRRVTPSIEPGYLQELIPEDPPNDPEDWDDIMNDVEKKIMIGVSEVTVKKMAKIVVNDPSKGHISS